MFHSVSINEHKTNIHKTTVEYTKKHNHEPVTRATVKLWWNLKGGVFCAKSMALVGRGPFVGFQEAKIHNDYEAHWNLEGGVFGAKSLPLVRRGHQIWKLVEGVWELGFGQKGTPYLEIGRSGLRIWFWDGFEGVDSPFGSEPQGEDWVTDAIIYPEAVGRTSSSTGSIYMHGDGGSGFSLRSSLFTTSTISSMSRSCCWLSLSN